MDKQFFTSKEFAISAIVAALVVGAGAYAAVDVFENQPVRQGGCELSAASGEPVEAAREASEPSPGDEGLEQTITWRLDLDGESLTSVDACTGDDRIQVVASQGDSVEVTASLENDGERARQAIDATEVRARFVQQADGIALTVDKPPVDEPDSLDDHSRTRVDFTVQVPSDQAPALSVQADDGHVDVEGVELSRLSLSLDDGRANLENVATQKLDATSDDGDLRARELSIHGDVDLTTDDGLVRLRVTSIGSGDWEYNGDDGLLGLRLPADGDIGYDVSAATDNGNIVLELHNSSKRISSDGGTANARSNDYDERDVQVEISASADDGEIEIISGGPWP